MSSAVQKLFFKNFIFRNQVQYVQVFDTSGNYSMYSNNRDVKFLIKVNILHEHLYSLTQPELVGKLSSSFSMEVLEIVFQASSRIFQNSFFLDFSCFLFRSVKTIPHFFSNVEVWPLEANP